MALFKGFLGLLVCCLSANWAAASHIISREVLDLSHGGGRILMDGATTFEPSSRRCEVDFMKTDYSSLSQCIMPFPKGPCCEGFMEVACPVTNFINNMETDCASDMFAGIYISNPTVPPGYFANNCNGGPEGVDCLEIMNKSKMKATSGATPEPPRRGSAEQAVDSLAKRKLEIMRHHPKQFPQAATMN